MAHPAYRLSGTQDGPWFKLQVARRSSKKKAHPAHCMNGTQDSLEAKKKGMFELRAKKKGPTPRTA